MLKLSNPTIGLSLWVSPKLPGNPLKHFMGWLKTHAPKSRFSHSHWQTTLHQHLSLTENWLMALEENPNEEDPSEWNNLLVSRLEEMGLGSFLIWFSDISKKPCDLSSEEQCLAAVLHSLMSKAHATFIDLGSVEITELRLAQLQKLLAEKSQERHIIVYLDQAGSWDHLIYTPFELDETSPRKAA